MIRFIRREPALCGGLVQAVVALAIAFGLDLTEKQQGAIVGLSAVILAIVVRSAVTPVAKQPPAG